MSKYVKAEQGSEVENLTDVTCKGVVGRRVDEKIIENPFLLLSRCIRHEFQCHPCHVHAGVVCCDRLSQFKASVVQAFLIASVHDTVALCTIFANEEQDRVDFACNLTCTACVFAHYCQRS